MLPYVNREIKGAFRWYRKEALRTRHRKECRDGCDDPECVFAQIWPEGIIPPFQLDVDSDAAPTAWRVYALDGTVELDLSIWLPSLEVLTFAAPMRHTIMLQMPLEPTPPNGIKPGIWEMVIEVDDGESVKKYYSETFRVWDAAKADCLHLLKWRNCGDAGTVHYHGNAFMNHLWLDSSVVHIGEPLPVFKFGTETDGKEKDTRIKGRKDVEWRMRIEALPWYLIDAITDAALMDQVMLTIAGEQVGDLLTAMRVEFVWDDDLCRPPTTIIFRVDEATVVTGCCEEFPLCDFDIPFGIDVECDSELGIFTISIFIPEVMPSGFSPGAIVYTGGQIDAPGTNKTHVLGPFNIDSEVEVYITNALIDDCRIDIGTISGCPFYWRCTEAEMISAVYQAGSPVLNVYSTTDGDDTDDIGIRKPDLSHVYQIPGGEFAPDQSGEYCIWASDEDGNVVGTINSIAVIGDTLKQIDLSRCSVMQAISIYDLSLISIAMPTNTSLLDSVALDGCSLPTVMVDHVLNSLDPAIAGGIVTITGGGNQCPSAASAAAIAALVGNGWTVTTLPPCG